MKKIFLVISILLLTFNFINAQEIKKDSNVVKADSIISRNNLVKQYKTELDQLNQSLNRRVLILAMDNENARRILNDLGNADIEYNQLLAQIIMRIKDLEKLEPKEKKLKD
jgi:hypothetical protein